MLDVHPSQLWTWSVEPERGVRERSVVDPNSRLLALLRRFMCAARGRTVLDGEDGPDVEQVSHVSHRSGRRDDLVC